MPDNYDYASYRITRDTKHACVRMLSLELAGYDVSITYNESLKSAYVSVRSNRSVFSPKIDRMKDGSFSICYDYAVVFEDNREEFEREYRRAADFCDNAGPAIDTIIAGLVDGKDLI